MKAKFKLDSIRKTEYGEEFDLSVVVPDKFDETGKSDDNTFARWTPTGHINFLVTNPALFNVYQPGQKFYVNFSLAD